MSLKAPRRRTVALVDRITRALDPRNPSTEQLP